MENSWAPRKSVVLDLPTEGNKCLARRPGPELALKIARLQRTLKSLREVSASEGDTEETLARMTPEQERASLDVMRVTVVACVKEPRLYLDPKGEQVGVDDIPPEDFLFIWNWYQSGCPDIPVAETEDGEVSVADVNNFPVEQRGGVGVGGDGGDVPESESIAAVGR